jgi:catechol 2,3-dioxygenase-like lactoylglutathione lyase family enzyme
VIRLSDVKVRPQYRWRVRQRLIVLQFASLVRDMRLGQMPSPGGWNRIHLIVDDLAAEVHRLRAAGVHFRNDIVTGPGGSQILLDDPSGNPVELFQPRRE